MKKNLFLIITILICSAFYLVSFLHPEKTEDSVYADQEGELLVPQSNVGIAVVDIEKEGLSLTRAEDIPIFKTLHERFAALPNVVKVESLFNASRVISEGEDILVKRAVPDNPADLSDEYLQKLVSEIDQFPELTPYVNTGRNTLIYYIYFANDTPAADIYNNMKSLQNEWKERLYFDYTGRAPIIAATEAFLTGDMELTFPVLAVMVIAVLLLFRNVKVVIVSLVLIVLSMGGGYGLARFLGLSDTPLVLLIPVFSLGLLSDYLIHYYYHYFYTDHNNDTGILRKSLMFPLSLTAISTLTGFFSLSLINGSGHIELGIIISAAVVITWFGIFFWICNQKYVAKKAPLFPEFQSVQARFFEKIVNYRYLFFLLIGFGVVWGIMQLSNIRIEPYPIKQLPDTTTIKKADTTINKEFYGTLPFFLEIDTGEKNGILKKESIEELAAIHKAMDDSSVGYAFSMLTVLKRMHFYFTGAEETLLSGTEYDDYYDSLIEQYLLYYSSSVDPLEYESLLDNSYRIFSVKGLLYYNSYDDLKEFTDILDELEDELPQGWSIGFYGMAAQLEKEHDNLRYNWVLSFVAGSFMIFITVLIFYRKLSLALISLLPGMISMFFSFGLINIAGISIDVFSIIFVAIITGLVVDYSIHTLSSIDKLDKVENMQESFLAIVGYSGVPIFLSFVTSLLSFLVLFISSFKGARNLGFILIASLILSFFLSLYLIPLIILPRRLKKESQK